MQTGPTVYVIAALLISLTALFFSFRRHQLKTGVEIRGFYYTTMAGVDAYISTVILENLKDRAVTVFGIYLKIGNACYLEVDDFEKSPVILKAFETFHKEYGPVIYYDAGGMRILLDDVIRDRKVKKRLVLSTSHGKYTVPSYFPSWNPISELFGNYMTALAQPIRATYKGKSYGSNVKFLIEFEADDGEEEVVAIHPRDFQVKVFRHFQLTKDAIESKASLEAFLAKQREEGNLAAKSLKVLDLDKWREEQYRLGELETIEWTDRGRFRYYVIGWLLTNLEKWKTWRTNRALAKRNKQAGVKFDKT